MRNRKVQKALRKAGVPTKAEIAAAERRVQEELPDRNMCGQKDVVPREAVRNIRREELQRIAQMRGEREDAVRRITREVKYGDSVRTWRAAT